MVYSIECVWYQYHSDQMDVYNNTKYHVSHSHLYWGSLDKSEGSLLDFRHALHEMPWR
jgi:hypothetical protein